MEPISSVKNVSSLIMFGTAVLIGIFINILRRQEDITVLGLTVSSDNLHLALGPILVGVNGLILFHLLIIFYSDFSPTSAEALGLRAHNPIGFLGPVANPFHVRSLSFANWFGYAFFIFLWWIGMHAFWKSVSQNDTTAAIMAWNSIVGGLYLVIGLSSMLVIQAIFQKIGMQFYMVKFSFALIGIGAGFLLPRLLIKLLASNE